jgi:hypothetical protein
MADFIYESLPASASEDQIEAACRWVDPNLRHFGRPVEEPPEEDAAVAGDGEESEEDGEESEGEG